MSYPYQIGIFFASLFYLAIGFIYLRKLLLLLQFDDVIIALVLIVIAFGTNYYYYTIYGKEMTHIYLFALQAMFAYYLHLYTQNNYKKNILKLSIIAAIMVLVRSSEIVIFVFAAFYGLNTFANWKRNMVVIVSMLLSTILLFFIQFLFYKINNNVWFINGYKGFYFDWLHPKFWYCLFSPTKGWFIYSPLLFLSIMGFCFPSKNNPVQRIAIGLFLICNCYLLFCWSDYNYGTTFGCRPVVQSYAILSMLFALFFQKLKLLGKPIQIALSIIIFGFICLNFFQTWQYSNSILAYRNNTWSYYWYTFGRTDITLRDLVYLRIDEKFYYQNYQFQKIYYSDTIVPHLGKLAANHQDYVGLKKTEITTKNIDNLSKQWMHIRFDSYYKGDDCSNDNMPSVIVDVYRGKINLKWNIIGIPVLMNNKANDSISFFIQNPELKIGDEINIYSINQTSDSVNIHNFKMDRVQILP